MPRNNRDDFTEATKRTLAQRAGYRCSRPGCDAATIGPSTESPTATASIGKACHIAAAARGPGARRFDPAMTREQRRAHTNGIWMCATCGDLIDRDAVRYPEDLLRRWKELAESRAQRRLGAPEGTARHLPSVLFDELVAAVHAAELLSSELTPTGFRCELGTNVFLPFAFVPVSCVEAGPGSLVEFMVWTPAGIVHLGTAMTSPEGATGGHLRVPLHPFLPRGRYVFEARVVGGPRFATWVDVPETRAAPSLRASPTRASVDDEVSVEGEGFPPNDRVEVFFYDLPGTSGQWAGEPTTDATGAFTLRFRVPTFEDRMVTGAGRHLIKAHAFRCIAAAEVEVLPYDWSRAVTRHVNEVTANGFFSVNIREVSISQGRVALDYSLLNRMNVPVALTPAATLVFRGPQHELVGVMMGEEEHLATPEVPDPVLNPGQYFSKRQEFAYMSQDGRAGLSPGVPAVALCVRVGGIAAGHAVGIEAVLQLDDGILGIVASSAQAEEGALDASASSIALPETASDV